MLRTEAPPPPLTLLSWGDVEPVVAELDLSSSLLPWSLWRAAALSLQPNHAVHLWFVVSIIPPHPHAHTHARTDSQALTRMRVIVAQCDEDGAGALASVK